MSEREIITIEKNCFGCNEYEIDLKYEPTVEHHIGTRKTYTCTAFNEDGSCPCTNCIIKMICEEPCKNIQTWYSMREREFRNVYKEKIRNIN